MLTEIDKEYLDAQGFRYSVIADGQMIALIIHDYELPDGYQPKRVDLLLRLAAGFPDAAPDMFWTHPVVSYADGGIPQATGTRLDFNGRVWQRWSRHLAIGWRPGIDNLQTYLRLIRTDLENGAEQIPAAA